MASYFDRTMKRLQGFATSRGWTMGNARAISRKQWELFFADHTGREAGFVFSIDGQGFFFLDDYGREAGELSADAFEMALEPLERRPKPSKRQLSFPV